MTHDQLDTHALVRAYFIWESEGRLLWHHERHWRRAQAEIAAELLAEINAEVAARALPRPPARPATPLRKKRLRLALDEAAAP